ncbi:MAG: hypothetical protein CGW95_17055 [Phenylobacterium zucineum]|nr:MAG: hypothetical protein CGW95_17055 [Phenylobacterium zucineum]
MDRLTKIVLVAVAVVWAGVIASVARAQVVNPNVSQANINQTICVPGWTATVRPPVSYTDKLKRALVAETPAADAVEDYELDHVVPLAVGGHPTDPRNLHLQLWDGPDGAHAKDVVEVRMKKMVCDRKISLLKAQACFIRGWQTCPK